MTRTRHAPATHGYHTLQITAGPFDRNQHIALHDERGVIGYYSRLAALRLIRVLRECVADADVKVNKKRGGTD